MDFDTFLGLATPERWTLRCRHDRPGIPAKQQRHVFLPFPSSRDLADALDAHGRASSGVYVVAAMPKGTADQKAAERAHLGLQEDERIAQGQVAYVRPDGRDDPPPLPAEPAEPAASARGSDRADYEQERKRLEHEIEVLRLQQERDRIAQQHAPAPASGSTSDALLAQLLAELRQQRTPPTTAEKTSPQSWVAIIGAVAPLLAPVIQGLLDGRSRLLEELLKNVQARTKQDPTETITGQVQAFAALRELAAELVPDVSQKGPLDKLVDVVQAMLAAKANETPAAPRAEAEPADRQQQQRAEQFLAALAREMAADSDPDTVADAMAPHFGLLPGRVREALLTQDPSSWESIIGARAGAIVQSIMQAPTARAWFERWRAAMLDDGDDEDDGEPVDYAPRPGPGATENGPPAPSSPHLTPTAPWGSG